MSFCGESVPLENVRVWEEWDRQFLLAAGNETQVILWLKRSTRYFPFIEAKLKEYGLPDDLKYIAVAESDLLPYASSSKGAVGPWQFTSRTAERYGLKVGRYVDERLHFFKATEAALAYLKDLSEALGSWTLATASYNCGKKRLLKAIKDQANEDFYHLDLPLETERFIFKILAIKAILIEPGRYGFVLEPEDYYGPLSLEAVEMDFPAPVHLRVVAQAAGTTYKAVKELNPHLRRNSLPAGRQEIFLPEEGANGFTGRFAILTNGGRKTKRMVYRVKPGESLSSIAKRLNVSVNSLKQWNDLTNPHLIMPGQKLVYYSFMIE
jgi:LysM repeat protein